MANLGRVRSPHIGSRPRKRGLFYVPPPITAYLLGMSVTREEMYAAIAMSRSDAQHEIDELRERVKKLEDTLVERELQEILSGGGS